MNRRISLAVLCAGLVAAAPAAGATSRPAATTSGAARVTQTSATLTGSVNPHGLETTYAFQYGTKAGQYTASTGPVSAGAGVRAVAAAADVAGLSPNTVYHFRIVATNAKGTTTGADKSLRTLRQPLGFFLGAGPNPVTYGGSTTLLGQLTGTGSANHEVQIQSKPFPYTADWVNFGSRLVTDATGKFGLTVPNVTINTQFRAVTTDSKPVASDPVIVASAVAVRLHAGRTHVYGLHAVTFSGTVTPAEPGAPFYLQRLVKDTWINVKTGSVGRSSRFRSTIRFRHPGRYRVVVGVNNQNASGLSNTVTLYLKRHRS